MKKKFFVLIIIFLCLLVTSTVVSATASSTIKATITKIAMYFNGQKLSGKVVTIDKTTYVPVNVLSNYLGFKVNKSSSKLDFIEKVNKENLQSEINELKEHNKELSHKLRFYSGGEEDYTNQTDNEYFNSLNYATSMGNSVWPLKNNEFIKTPRDNANLKTWYKVDIKEGDGLIVSLKPQIDKGYLYLNLHSADGTLIASDSTISNGQYGTVGTIASKDSTYYISVAGETGYYYIGFYDSYWNNDFSNNDQRDYFGALAIGKKLISGEVFRDDVNLEDWYRVDVKEGQTLTVDIQPYIDKGYMHLSLCDIDGVRLASAFTISNGKSGRVTKKASRDCTYFIVAYGATGKYYLNYSVY